MNKQKKAKNAILNKFQSLFYPQKVAIIGASKNPVGGIKYYRALKTSGFLSQKNNSEGETSKMGGNQSLEVRKNHNNTNKVFLINPKFAEEGLFGKEVYPTIQDPDIPKPVDLVIIAVPAKIVPDVLMECHQYAKFAVIYTSGFGESGNEGLEEKLRETIYQIDTRVVGPNCLGILNPYSKLSVFPNWDMNKGTISYISQSGGTMARLYIYLGSQNIGFRNAVSIGNAYDISITEIMEYFYHDEKTHMIALYLESISNGREFYEVTKKISQKKPIVLLKGGQTDRGKSASFSHTGGMAGSFKIWEAMAKQNGIMTVDHFELFADLVQVVNIRPIPPKNLNVAILAAGGGIGVELTDNFENAGLNVIELKEETQNALAKHFPSVNTNFKNPIDLGEYGYVPSLFAKAMKIVLNDETVGSVVFVREPERFPIISKNIGIEDPGKQTTRSIQRILRRVDKPVFCNPSANSVSVEAFQMRKDFQDKMIAAKIPVINIFKNIPEIIKQLYRYGKFLDNYP